MFIVNATVFFYKSTDNSQGQQSTRAECYPRSYSPMRAHKFDIMAGMHWYDSLYPSTKLAMDPPSKTLCIWPTWTPEIK